jgi:DNA-binding CsgD family transcriptional regulator
VSYTNALTSPSGSGFLSRPIRPQVAHPDVAHHVAPGFEIGDLIARALDWLSCGIVIVDEDIRPLFTNRAARRLIQGGRLPLASRATLHRLDPIAGLRRAMAELGEGRSKATCSVGDPPLICTVASLTRPSAGKKLRAILFVMDSARKRKTRLTDVHGFGLSRAQASFAIEFANGHSLRTCAERLGISLSTAKTHLQQIFAKTGASRQAELMRLILLSTPALDDEDDSVN